MKTIIETIGEPFMIEDRTTPVCEITTFAAQGKTCMWLSLHEAWSVTGVPVIDVAASAHSNTPAPNGLQFQWPSRATITKYLPEYRVIWNRPAQLPRPVLATFSIKTGRRVLAQSIPYRSMTQFRTCNELSRAQADAILARHPGWQKHLPRHMVNAVGQSPGWIPPGGWPNTAGVKLTTPLFELSLSPGGVLLIKYIGPPDAVDFSAVPHAVLANS